MIKKRHTKQKDIVLSFIKRNKDKHLTVEQILLNIKRENEDVSQATIYRILGNLVEEGIVRKYITSENKSSCYQYVDNVDKCNTHYHLVCEKCGKIIHFENKSIENLKEQVLKDNEFNLNLQKVVLYGTCNSCK